MVELIKDLAPILSIITVFLVGYIKLKERVASMEAKIASYDKESGKYNIDSVKFEDLKNKFTYMEAQFVAHKEKLKEVEEKMNKYAQDHYTKIQALEVNQGRSEERDKSLIEKIDIMMSGFKELKTELANKLNKN